MKIVVGLGNPGSNYEGTRHNVGFDLITELTKRHHPSGPKSQFDGLVSETMIDSEKVLLVTPVTFMNLSGRCVRPFVNFYKLNPKLDLLVVCDDINIDLGRLRFRANGTDGGQKGLRDIISQLGSKEIPRLRIGVGKPPAQYNVSDYVLGKFSSQERQTIDTCLQKAATAVEDWVKEGLISAMNRFNSQTISD